MNVVIMVGRLATDPDTKQTNSGNAMTTFRLAVEREYKQEGQPDADFFRIITYGKTANNVSKYCLKGNEVAIRGRIQTGSYKTKDGETRYTTDIIADRVKFIGGRKEKRSEYEGFEEFDDGDDFPF